MAGKAEYFEKIDNTITGSFVFNGIEYLVENVEWGYYNPYTTKTKDSPSIFLFARKKIKKGKGKILYIFRLFRVSEQKYMLYISSF